MTRLTKEEKLEREKLGRLHLDEDRGFLVEEAPIRPYEWADKHRPAWHKKVYGCRG